MNEEGLLVSRQSAEKISKILPKPDYIFSSPVLRALQTAEFLHMYNKEAKFDTMDEFKELDFGVWAGKNISDHEAQFDEFWRSVVENREGDDKWDNLPGGKHPRGSLSSFHTGLKVARDRCLLEAGSGSRKVIFIVTHSQITKLFMINQNTEFLRKNKNISYTKIILTDSGEIIIDPQDVYIDVFEKHCEL